MNCVGIIAQLSNVNDELARLTINSSLLHRLAKYSSMVGARVLHFNTDCEFSGKAGQYKDDDFLDAYDLYLPCYSVPVTRLSEESRNPA